MTNIYPLDITGVSPSNLITNESQLVNFFQYQGAYLVIPEYAPFYEGRLGIEYGDGVNPGRELKAGTDYVLAFPYIGASRSIGLPVYGAILLNPSIVSGSIFITYQTLGGQWDADNLNVYNNILLLDSDPRNNIWDVVTDVQSCFPSTNNSNIVDTSSGLYQLIEALDNLSYSIANKQQAIIRINNY